jgi:hypothetical protein
VEVLHKDFGETSVNIGSSRREKVELLKKLCIELEPHYKDVNVFKDMIANRTTNFLQLSIDKEEAYIPKPNLKFAEYNAIKNNFSAADFERNAMLILGLPITSMALYMI